MSQRRTAGPPVNLEYAQPMFPVGVLIVTKRSSARAAGAIAASPAISADRLGEASARHRAGVYSASGDAANAERPRGRLGGSGRVARPDPTGAEPSGVAGP